MKGIIVEKQNGYAILLTKDGNFEKIRDKQEYLIGSEYDIRNNYFINKKFASIAAAITLVFGVSTAAYGYMTPSEYVTIDINPSVELVTNMFHKVIRVNPLNNDGTKIVENLNLSNKNVEEAVNLVVNSAKNGGYLAEDLQNQILVTVCSKDDSKSKKTEAQLDKIVKKELSLDKVGYTPVTTQSVSIQRHEEAEKLGISSGKMNLIEKIEEVQPGIDYKEYSEKPVKELMKEIKEIKKEDKASNKEQNVNVNKDGQKQEVQNKQEQNTNIEKKQENDTQKKNNQKDNNYIDENKKKDDNQINKKNDTNYKYNNSSWKNYHKKNMYNENEDD